MLDPAIHDRAVAAISHLPYALAVTLMSIVNAGQTPAAWSLAASGFRDTSRVVGSDVGMMLDILMTNREAVLEWLGAFAGQLTELRDELDRRDEPALRERLTAAPREPHPAQILINGDPAVETAATIAKSTFVDWRQEQT